MDKTFICLANSYKHGNRCIAGIEIDLYPQRNSYSVKRDANGNPIWFRPVHRTAEAGAIPNSEAQSIVVLDIVKACLVEPCPDGAQTENYYYSRLEKLSRVSRNTKNLDGFIDNSHSVLFGNRGATVPPDRFVNLDYSVLLIKSSQVEFYMKDRAEWNREPQPRGKVMHNDTKYDLPVTDPIFRQVIQNNIEEANSYTDYYITLSLGVEHDDSHFKLIACVIPFQETSHTNVHPRQDISENRAHLKKDSQRISFTLFQQGLSIEQIAERRGLKPETVGAHLTHFIESRELEIRRLVSDDKIRRIVQYKFNHPNEDKLKPLFDAFNGNITYTEIRWVLAAINSCQIPNNMPDP